MNEDVTIPGRLGRFAVAVVGADARYARSYRTMRRDGVIAPYRSWRGRAACHHNRTDCQPVCARWNSLAARSTTDAQRFTHREAIGLPEGEARAARCTSGEAVRSSDERCEESCGARLQEAERVPPNYNIHMNLCDEITLNNIDYCDCNALFDIIFSQGGYFHG